MPLQTYILMAVTWFKNIKEKNMALTEAIEYDSITVKAKWNIEWRKAHVIKRDGTEISRTFQRGTLVPYYTSKDSDGKFTHTDTDLSDFNGTQVKEVADLAWTDSVKNEFKTFVENTK